MELHTDFFSFNLLSYFWNSKCTKAQSRYPSPWPWHQKQNLILPRTPSPSLYLFLLLLGDLLLASGRLGFGRLDLGTGDLWSGQCLRRLLGLLGVGTERGSAARDVDVLSVVGNMLQGELGAVTCAQAHGARTQCVSCLTHFCKGKRRKTKGFYSVWRRKQVGVWVVCGKEWTSNWNVLGIYNWDHYTN